MALTRAKPNLKKPQRDGRTPTRVRYSTVSYLLSPQALGRLRRRIFVLLFLLPSLSHRLFSFRGRLLLAVALREYNLDPRTLLV